MGQQGEGGRLAIIAGSGKLPLYVAEAARERGEMPYIFALRGDSSADWRGFDHEEIGIGEITRFKTRAADLGITGVGRSALQRDLARSQERVAPAAQFGRGHTQLTGEQFQVLAAQQAEHGLLLAPRRHPAPVPGCGPVSASVVGALGRAHTRPNRLVHPPPLCSFPPAKWCLRRL